MAVLTPQTITGAGIAPTYGAAAAGGDSFPVNTDQRHFLHVKNGGASPITVTITPVTLAEKTVGAGSLTVPSLGGSVAATSDKMFGPFPVDYMGANGQVQVTYSAVTTVTVAALVLPKA